MFTVSFLFGLTLKHTAGWRRTIVTFIVCAFWPITIPIAVVRLIHAWSKKQ